ncbi:uncharacterized protein CDAR_543541 [Caerostris darwini]|uniref:RNase H type-1 domain-containing protein n=1 Tax=Caerostris darwini TaxID=1538125 RepID=A0AAV4V2I2_9ARAC|nr:uncharacterized protein CDAR_543541 [Caerostris darwini]
MTVIKTPAVHGAEFNKSEYESVSDLWDTYPALRKSVLFDLPEPFGSEIEMYKDRSGMEGRYGSHLVVLYYGQIHSEMRRLEDHASVYQAELVAIHMALTWTLKLKEVKSINIYSDSRSALQALADPSNTSELVLEFKRMHELATARRMVYLHWLKAHVGYLGNVLADESAKDATKIGDVGWTWKKPRSRIIKDLKELQLSGRFAGLLAPKAGLLLSSYQMSI